MRWRSGPGAAEQDSLNSSRTCRMGVFLQEQASELEAAIRSAAIEPVSDDR